MLSDETYNIKITPTYEMKITGYSSVRNVSSKVESFVIHKYDTEDKLKELVNMMKLIAKEKQISCIIDDYKDNN